MLTHCPHSPRACHCVRVSTCAYSVLLNMCALRVHCAICVWRYRWPIGQLNSSAGGTRRRRARHGARRRGRVMFAHVTHNLAIAPLANGSYLLAGGRYRPSVRKVLSRSPAISPPPLACPRLLTPSHASSRLLPPSQAAHEKELGIYISRLNRLGYVRGYRLTPAPHPPPLRPCRLSTSPLVLFSLSRGARSVKLLLTVLRGVCIGCGV